MAPWPRQPRTIVMKPRQQVHKLESVCRLADRVAAERRERLSTTHLLVAMAQTGGVAWELLRDRRMEPEQLGKAARVIIEDDEVAVAAAERRAAEVAATMRAPDVNDVHLLIALVGQRRSAAYRTLEQFGVDVGRLRVAAMNAALLLVGRQSIQTRKPAALERPKAVTVPLTKLSKARLPVKLAAESQASPARPKRSTARPVPGPNAPEALRRGPRGKKTEVSSTARFTLDRKRFKALTRWGRNLTELASRGELPEVVGRESLLDDVLDVLAKREGNSPCLVGLSGVGKTTLVYGLARRIAAAAEPRALDDALIIELSVSALLAGGGSRGDLSQRLLELAQEAQSYDGRVVLFIDDVHQLLAAGGGEEVLGELRRAAGDPGVSYLTTLSPAAWQQWIETDAGLARGFCRIDVPEPPKPEASQIVRLQAQRIADFHRTPIDSAACDASVDWTARYLPGRALPDKAIAVLDLASARCRRRGVSPVESKHVAEVVAEQGDVPIERLLETDGERMLRLEDTLREGVVGHESHLKRIASIIRRNAAGLGGARPIGTFLLLGPTGVGKTETAKAVATALFGSARAMTRLDLSEFSEAHAVARLIGAPPGYIGHEAGGQLTEAVRRRPYQVVLLDEIEKAHPEVLETFLPLLDEGRLSDGRGRTVDFTNTILFLTSNIGAREATGGGARAMGFATPEDRGGGVEQRVLAAAKAALAPEFFNRLDEVLVFEALHRSTVEEIARRMLRRLAGTVAEQHGIELAFDVTIPEQLIASGGFDASLGARPMRRAIARLVEAPLAEVLLRGDCEPGGELRVLVRDGKIVLVPSAGNVAAED